jgi:DNA polymerase-3 subunit epsilon
MREICFDTETTGLNPNTGDKVVEIACVEMINRVRTGDFFHVYINPRRDMPEGAFKVHGLSAEFLSDKPIFAHVAQSFLDYIKDSTIIAHNAKFDMKFLNFELTQIGMNPIPWDNVIDSLAIAREKFPGAANSLDALCRRFNLDLSKRTKHGALLDSELLADVYIELMGGAQEKLKFASEEKTAQKISSNIIKKGREIIKSRDFKVDDADLKAHQEFIANNFKTNFWGY